MEHQEAGASVGEAFGKTFDTYAASKRVALREAYGNKASAENKAKREADKQNKLALEGFAAKSAAMQNTSCPRQKTTVSVPGEVALVTPTPAKVEEPMGGTDGPDLDVPDLSLGDGGPDGAAGPAAGSDEEGGDEVVGDDIDSPEFKEYLECKYKLFEKSQQVIEEGDKEAVDENAPAEEGEEEDENAPAEEAAVGTGAEEGVADEGGEEGGEPEEGGEEASSTTAPPPAPAENDEPTPDPEAPEEDNEKPPEEKACKDKWNDLARKAADLIINPPAPATDPPATDPPAVDPPATDPPATDPPATDPPATDPPAVDPPATDPPATDPPAVDPPTTDPQTEGGPQPAEGGPNIVDEFIRIAKILIAIKDASTVEAVAAEEGAEDGPSSAAAASTTAPEAGVNVTAQDDSGSPSTAGTGAAEEDSGSATTVGTGAATEGVEDGPGSAQTTGTSAAAEGIEEGAGDGPGSAPTAGTGAAESAEDGPPPPPEEGEEKPKTPPPPNPPTPEEIELVIPFAEFLLKPPDEQVQKITDNAPGETPAAPAGSGGAPLKINYKGRMYKIRKNGENKPFISSKKEGIISIDKVIKWHLQQSKKQSKKSQGFLNTV